MELQLGLEKREVELLGVVGRPSASSDDTHNKWNSRPDTIDKSDTHNPLAFHL